MNISKKNNKDDTILSNSIILSVISNFLDIKNEDKKSRKINDISKTQIKSSVLKKPRTKINSTKSIQKINNNRLNVTTNLNNSYFNESKNSNMKNSFLSLGYDATKKKRTSNKNQRRSENKINGKDILKQIASQDTNQKKTYSISIDNLNKKGTFGGDEENKNGKFKPTFIGLDKPIDEILIKRKKTNRSIRKSRLSKINIKGNKRRLSYLPAFNSLHRYSKNNLMPLTKEKEESNNDELMTILALRKINKKLKNNIDNNIKNKLYKYENNDITDAINKLPSIKQEDKNKAPNVNKHTENSDLNPDKSTSNIKEDISQNNEIENRIKNDEKYRVFILKQNVYDSLDDEEIVEEIVDNFFFEPNSEFILFFDSVIMISSIIILTYFPLYLAKNISFSHSFYNYNNIMFYIIDFIYIMDFILGFFRAFYNFDELLIRNSSAIFKHYLKGWLIYDLITSVPVFTLIKFLSRNFLKEDNISYSLYYNTNLNNLLFLFAFFKVIKTFKVFNCNYALNKLDNILSENEFISNWGNVFLFLFFFVSSINFSACLFIFVGRNTYPSWIIKFHFENMNFWHIYIASIYYIIVTITTVGYGDIVGDTLIEIIFQGIILIAGTCIYSWLISSTSSYIKKINDVNIQYEKKLKMLYEIRISNPNFTNDLYEKIIRLLNYRKYYEETDKQIILDSLPCSLRNSLTIEMYKPLINNFIFFKNITNRNFVVQVVSKLKPALSVKGDILVQEGDFIEDVMFVKEGILSLEIKIDLDYPDLSIEKYLSKNKLISPKAKKPKHNEKTMSLHRDSEITSDKLFRSKLLAILGEPSDNNEETEALKKSKQLKTKILDYSDEYEYDNHSYIKIINIKKNEHFGDVFMFLNKHSPFYVRVRTKKAELLLLRKLDAVSISTSYPKIWKKIIAKSLTNTKKINNLTLKMLITFYNFHGIKTKFFKQRKYCIEDLKRFLPDNDNNNNLITKRKQLPLNNEVQKIADELNENGNNYEDYINSSYCQSEESQIYDKNEIPTVIYEEQDEGSFSDDSKRKTNVRNKNKSKKKISMIKGKEDIIKLNNRKSAINLDKLNLNKNEKVEKYIKSTKTCINKNNKINSYKININKSISNHSNSPSSSNSKYNKSEFKRSKSDNNDNNNDSYNSKDGNSNDSNDIKNSNCDNDRSENSSKKSKENNESKFNKNNSNKDDKLTNKSNNNNSNDNNFNTKKTRANISFNNNDSNKKNVEFLPGTGRTFDIKANDEKVNDSNNHYPEKIYIKNLNIFESNYLNQIFNKKEENTEPKHHKSKSEEKKFKNLEISSESTLDINSSYENINSLTNYNYISDEELRKKTKKFLLGECGINLNISEKNIKKINVFERSHSKKSQSSNALSSLLSSTNDKKGKKIKNVSSLQSFQTNKNRFNKPKMSIIKGTSFLQKMNSTLGGSESKSNKNIYKFRNSGGGIKEKEKDKIKKHKRKKEMFMISNNIKQNSENLNNPDMFYAGLFNNIMEKQKKNKKRKYNNSISEIK